MRPWKRCGQSSPPVEAGPACRAGLWLAFDFFEESHRLSQDLDTAEGGLWHGILHRREGDDANAGYWFRRAGPHPVLLALESGAAEWGFHTADERGFPYEFIRQCSEHRGADTEYEQMLRRIQGREWELLFNCCQTRSL